MNRYIKQLNRIVEERMQQAPKVKTKGLLSPKGSTMPSSKSNDIIERMANYVIDIRKKRMEIKNGN
jgi:hypothetical protein